MKRGVSPDGTRCAPPFFSLMPKHLRLPLALAVSFAPPDAGPSWRGCFVAAHYLTLMVLIKNGYKAPKKSTQSQSEAVLNPTTKALFESLHWCNSPSSCRVSSVTERFVLLCYFFKLFFYFVDTTSQNKSKLPHEQVSIWKGVRKFIRSECVSVTIRHTLLFSSMKESTHVLGKYLKSKQAGPIKSQEVVVVWLHLSGEGEMRGENWGRRGAAAAAETSLDTADANTCP